MKLFFLISLLPLSAFSFSSGLKWSPASYTVVSNEYDSKIESGHFVIRGIIDSGEGTDPIIGATITNADQSRGTTTDLNGLFNFKFQLKDSLIYCYAQGFSEVVIQESFQNKHVITVKVHLPEQAAVVFKPVLYAYNCLSDIAVSLQPKGNFTFTYPKSDEGKWTISTNDDGTITNLSDGKNYPYLFWEGENSDFKIAVDENVFSGFIIKTDTCISFLERVLKGYGLNEKESTDFITFWGPKISEKPFALVQFLNTNQYESEIATLTVSPKPETLLRLYMYLIPLDSSAVSYAVKAPEIKPLNRNGFTIVEWGGSILNLSHLIN